MWASAAKSNNGPKTDTELNGKTDPFGSTGEQYNEVFQKHIF